MSAPPVLWTPSDERIARARITSFARDRGLPGDYPALWRWSVDHLEDFWAAIWDEFAPNPDDPSYDRVLASRAMPGATWFPGARVNYAGRLLAGRPSDEVAIRHASELRPLGQWTWGDLRTETARIAAGLRRLGVGEGDRVAAYLPNVPETVAAFLATASLGAVWAGAAPEFGVQSVVDRFAQIEPKVLLAVDGYRYGGRDFDRTEVGEGIAERIGARAVRFGYLSGAGWEDGFLGAHDAELDFRPVAFDHPLWVLFSSGTTGLPKAIVHGQGGMLLEHLKVMHLHLDAQVGDRIFWFTTTGWMMWNFLVGVLLTEASIVLWDGSPAGDVLWELAADAGVTTFGTSAAFIAANMKDGLRPAAGRDLSALRAVGSTGSPLAPEGFDWISRELGSDTWLFSTSGGTDVCTAFVGGVPTLPVYEGELQAPALGAKVESWDDDGQPHVGRVGELVLTEPMPCMPLGFWGDPDGRRLSEAYFEHYPGVWRHGDWIELTERGSAVIYGRSDSTINRGGIRMGTSEIYRSVLAEPEVVDAVVVDVGGRPGFPDGWMPLFVVLREGEELHQELVARIARRVRSDCSPRHVPNEVFRIDEVPRTLSGKVLEVPIKRILMGTPAEEAASRESLANPAALDWFVAFAQQHR